MSPAVCMPCLASIALPQRAGNGHGATYRLTVPGGEILIVAAYRRVALQ